MEYKDIFIDFDDTIYDTRGNAQIALKQTFEDFGLLEYFPDPQVFYDAYWHHNMLLWRQYAHGEIDKDFLVVERFRLPLALGFEADRDYCLRISEHFLGLCSEMPGTIAGAHEMLLALKEMGYHLHVASNGFRREQYKKLKVSGLQQYFDKVILSEDAGVNKPSREFFEYALRETGADAETSLMIGDNYDTDILGAKKAGIHTMLFNRWDPQFVPDIPADHTVLSLSEIPDVLRKEISN